MPKAIRYALRFAVIVAVLATLPNLFTPTNTSSGPYMSALSDLASAPVMAAGLRCGTSCAIKRGKYTCVHTGAPTVCAAGATGCVLKSC